MLGLEKWGTQAAFCALPANSYHVTAWDGVNINNLESVAASDRADFQQLLEDLPGSLDSPLLDLIYQSDLMKWKDWHIEFQFAQLSTWRNKVIAIELQPADTKSAHHFQHFISLRQQLSHQFIDRYQLLTTAKEFVPHVTLGYFANTEAGAQAAPMLEQHREAFREIMAPARLSFRSLSLYGLTDMASFYR